MSPLIYIFLVTAIGIAVVAEVLVAYQKYQMKKQFVDQLDQVDQKGKNDKAEDK